jgi:hypothetical protein
MGTDAEVWKISLTPGGYRLRTERPSAANNLNRGRKNTVNGERVEYFPSSLSGDRGRTAAAAEGPWSCVLPFAASRGSHKTLVLPEFRRPTGASAVYRAVDCRLR